MAATNEEAVLARFVEVYGATERGRRLWDEWMAAQSEAGRSILEQLAEAAAEERGVSLDEARVRLAAEKLVQDRGIDYAEKYLTKRDAAELIASRPLKPMSVGRTKKR
jgi:hypothetical protein